MMLLSYYTVKNFGEHEIVIKNSRFIASVRRAENEGEARGFIADIKKQKQGANHHCSAYMIGAQDVIQKANDDGEPTGTAGIPMLEVLKKRSLKDTVVVVTRYFGGIKLGAGGLIRAYGTATTEGLDAAGIVKRQLMTIIHITTDYSLLGKLENELHQAGYPLKDIHYLEQVEIEAYVPQPEIDTFSKWITNMTGGQAVLRTGKQAYSEIRI